MKTQIESILTENAVKIVNSTISYTNTFRSLPRIVMAIRSRIHALNLQKEIICGMGGSHIWVSYKGNNSRILLITK